MRQAGRYLSEYREVSKKKSFFEMSEDPEIACQVTLQPIKRFDLDFAIIFSDILTLPKALGVKIDIKKNIGPVIECIDSSCELDLESLEKNIQSTLQAINLTRKNLQKDKELIGFAGAPWTVALYIIEGGWTKTFIKTRQMLHQKKEEFKRLLI
jgi:uroporphyrinogen decarboxylase